MQIQRKYNIYLQINTNSNNMQFKDKSKNNKKNK